MSLATPIRKLAGLAAKPVAFMGQRDKAPSRRQPDKALANLEAAAENLGLAAAWFVEARDEVLASADSRSQVLEQLSWADKLVDAIPRSEDQSASEEPDS